MSRKQPTVPMSEEMHRRIEKTVEQGEWSSKAEYIRHLIAAGESNVAELDPRSNSSDNTGDFDAEKAILDGLTDEYQEVDSVLDSALNSLATRLDEMANSDSTSVKYHPRKGYKIEK